MLHTLSADWQADGKVGAADPHTDEDLAVPPEYTALPTSSSASAVGPNDSASNIGSPSSNEGLNIMVLIWTGLSAIIFPPAIVAGAAVASAAVMLYGCGKLLEGIGRGLAYAPELLYRACVGKQVKKVAATWRARRLEVQGQDVEAGTIAL